MNITKNLIIGIALSLGNLMPAVLADTLLTVALTRETAPGTTANFKQLWAPVINSTGQTAFAADLTGPGVDFNNDEGFWSEGSGTLALVARKGNNLPGVDAKYLGRASSMRLNSSGLTTFGMSLSGPETNGRNSSSIWREEKGTTSLVALEGSKAQGTNANFSEFAIPKINSAGKILFEAYLRSSGVTGSNNLGLWSEENNSLALVVRSGDVAPGTNKRFYDFIDPKLSNSGQIVFYGELIDGTEGIWSEKNGILSLVVLPGDPISGTDWNFSRVLAPTLNDTGQIAFLGYYDNASLFSSGIWLIDEDSLSVVAQSGKQAPDTNFHFSTFSSPPYLNGAGHVAFVGRLTGFGVSSGNNTGIWSEGSGSLALVARTGSYAPGTSVTFSKFQNSTPFILNGAGQVAFQANLTGMSVNKSNDDGIWAQDSSGALTLIARTGELLDVDDGTGVDFRTISRLVMAGYSGNEDSEASGFNDLGQLAFWARFTDGTEGVFVSNLVAVPEPNSLALLTMMGLSTILVRSRR